MARHSWLIHAFSTRRREKRGGGAAGLNLGFTAGAPRAAVRENRRLFFEQLGVEQYAVAELRQVHSDIVYQVQRARDGELEYCLAGIPTPERAGTGHPAGDALVTDQAGILLTVRTADCLPVLLVDPKRRAIAAVHAGWRGALARITQKTVGEMQRLYGSDPCNLLAAIGPSIRVCCYEVGEEVEEAFHGRFRRADRFFRKPSDPQASHSALPVLSFLNAQPPGHDAPSRPASHLDLAAVARDQLLSAGLSPRHVAAHDLCAACRADLFYSYRREGSGTGRMMAVIGIRPGTAAHA